MHWEQQTSRKTRCSANAGRTCAVMACLVHTPADGGGTAIENP